MAQRQFASGDTSAWAEKYGDGSDSSLTISADTTDSTANTTISATSGSTSATVGSGTGFAANNLILIHQSRNGGAGAGAWELNKISSVGGGTNWTLAYSTIQAYDTTAQVYLLKQYSSVTVNSTKTLTASAWDGSKGGILALMANTSITVTGNIRANGGDGSVSNPGSGGSGGGYRGGNASNSGNASQYGEGTSGANATSSNNNANGNGGGGSAGGGSNGGAGSGGGGHSSAGGAGNDKANGATYTGAGGGTAGAAALTTMVFGGGGGGGDNGVSESNASGGGGSGGGIIILISKNITVTGGITANGGGGGRGWAAGGGAAGGSILFKGQTITLGSSLVTASFGQGGSMDGTTNAGGNSSTESAAGASDGNGGNGSNGRIHADYLTSISGTTSPTLDSTQDSTLADLNKSFLLLGVGA